MGGVLGIRYLTLRLPRILMTTGLELCRFFPPTKLRFAKGV